MSQLSILFKGSCEDNTAYFHDPNSAFARTTKTSSDECQQACIDYPECQYWTWMKWTRGECYGDPPCHGDCYFKAEKKIVTSNSQYISGDRFCVLHRSDIFASRFVSSWPQALGSLRGHTRGP